MGAGLEEEDGGPECSVGGVGASSDSPSPPLPVGARMHGTEQELQRFTLERGDDYANDDGSTGEDDLNWWSRHQLTYPTLTRLTKKY